MEKVMRSETHKSAPAVRWTVAIAMVLLLSALGATAMAGMPEVGRVNINAATVAELATLPGIGDAKAAAIVEERTKKPFVSVDDLARVSGIGARTLEDLRARVAVDGSGPRKKK